MIYLPEATFGKDIFSALNNKLIDTNNLCTFLVELALTYYFMYLLRYLNKLVLHQFSAWIIMLRDNKPK